MLPVDDDYGANLGVTATVSLCQVLNSLSLSNRQHVQALVNQGALPRIVGISRSDCSLLTGGVRRKVFFFCFFFKKQLLFS